MSRRRKRSAQSQYIWEQLEQISNAYHRACCRGEDPGQARAAWDMLWQETAADEKLNALPIGDAGYLLWWGWVIAMHDRRYREATELLTAYFQHPQMQANDALVRTMNRCCLATSILYSGDEAEAVRIYHSLFESEAKSIARAALLQVRSSLLGYYSGRPSNEKASPPMAALVEGMTSRFRRRVPRKKRVPENATYADLLRLLESTYPPEGREALRREREQQSDPAAE